MIKISNLYKSFNINKSNEISVVKNMSLEIADKGIVAFYGKSGCGKTTLLNLIGGLDKSDSGTIEIENNLLTQKNADTIRNEYIGYIFQNYNLDENINVFDNVAIALKLCGIIDEKVIEERVLCALENVSLEKFAKRLPSSLSGGQQQRVAIARAIVKSPKIILADEPTGNLDESNTIKVMDILKRISKDALVLLVTHEHDLVSMYCDQVIELVDGSIKSNEIISNENTFASKDKRKIYLGDMPSEQADIGNIKIEYHGEKSLVSDIKIIETDGKIYIYSKSDTIKFLDSRSEIKVTEEKFVERKVVDGNDDLDMTALTPIKVKRSKMFSIWDSVKMGYEVAFKQGKATRKMMIALLMLFPIAITIMVSTMFSVVSLSDEISQLKFNKEIVRVEYNNDDTMQIVGEVIANNKSQVKGVIVTGGDNYGSNMSEVNFKSNAFMTGDAEEFKFNVNYLPIQSLKSEIIHGSKVVGLHDVVISAGTADMILESKYFDYITSPSQLIGAYLENENYGGTGDKNKIVGIVDEQTPYVYTSHENAFSLTYDHVYFSYMSQTEAKDNTVLQYDAANKTADVIVNYDLLAADLHAVFKKDVTYNFAGMMYTIVKTTGERNDDSSEILTEIQTNIPNYQGEKGAIIIGDNNYHDNAYRMNYVAGLNGAFIDIAVTDSVEFLAKLKEAGLNVTTYEDIISYNIDGVDPVLVTIWAVAVTIMTVVMTLCVFIVMRTSLMSRVKEIGVYRAIGASRKDILINFFISFLVLYLLTIAIGFMASSIFVWSLMGIHISVLSIINLPVWLWLLLGTGFFAITAVCAMTPLVLLLRKTPAEILAKYDI